jgi:hypothetical protein
MRMNFVTVVALIYAAVESKCRAGALPAGACSSSPPHAPRAEGQPELGSRPWQRVFGSAYCAAPSQCFVIPCVFYRSILDKGRFWTEKDGHLPRQNRARQPPEDPTVEP